MLEIIQVILEFFYKVYTCILIICDILLKYIMIILIPYLGFIFLFIFLMFLVLFALLFIFSIIYAIYKNPPQLINGRSPPMYMYNRYNPYRVEPIVPIQHQNPNLRVFRERRPKRRHNRTF